MSIQHYFDCKRQLFVSFFSQLQQIIRQLSVAVQFEIDREFAYAKQFLFGKPNTAVDKQFENMRSKEPQLLNKIIDIICQSCKAHCDAPNMFHHSLNFTNQFGTLAKGQTVSPPTIERNQQFQVIPQNNEQRNIIQSQKEITDFKPSQQSTISTKVNKTSNITPSKRTGKSCEPIKLLNKGKKQKAHSLTKPTHYINKNAFSDGSSAKTNNMKFHAEQLLRQNGNHEVGSTVKNLLHQFDKERQSTTISMQNQNDNQIVCEKLDEAIQLGALQILNKAKCKRISPKRQKTMDSETSRPSKSRNSFPILQISNNDPLGLRKPNLVQPRQRSQRV